VLEPELRNITNTFLFDLLSSVVQQVPERTNDFVPTEKSEPGDTEWRLATGKVNNAVFFPAEDGF
jgi:hypothetical protein